MQLELDDREVELLGDALVIHLGELNRELTRTEKRTLQHELAQEVARLEAIAQRIEALRKKG